MAGTKKAPATAASPTSETDQTSAEIGGVLHAVKIDDCNSETTWCDLSFHWRDFTGECCEAPRAKPVVGRTDCVECLSALSRHA